MTTPILRGSDIPMDMYLDRMTELEENRKWKIQDGGIHSLNGCISAPRLNSNEIQTAIPMLPRSDNLMGYVSLPYN